MSGRQEMEMRFERKTKNRLQDAPYAVEEFYYSLIGSGKTYDTAYVYINYILSFANFLQIEKSGEFDEDEFYKYVKPIDINKYMTALRTKTVNGKKVRASDSIRGVQWSALNTFFQFLVPDYIDSNPVASTQRPKVKDNPQVTYLTPEEIAKVLANVEKTAQPKLKNRDLCLLKLGFSTGLRISAILNIDVDDVDLENCQIRVTEKGDYDNYVIFGENLKKQLKIWLKEREECFGGYDTKALFVSSQGLRMIDDTVSYMLKKYSKGVTDKHVTPHVMRHSCATNLYEATGDIYLCAKQLNHKQVSTTQRYAELSHKKRKKAANILDGMI